MNGFRFHLELTPAQLKIVHTALRSLSDDFGHEESTVRRVIADVIAKLPDEHAIRAIELDAELERERAETEGASQNGAPVRRSAKA